MFIVIEDSHLGAESVWETLADCDCPMLYCSLRPYSSYQFRVAASNDVGTSNFSEPSPAVVTLEAAPDDPPTSVTARTVSPTSVVVSWTVSLIVHVYIQFTSWIGRVSK